MTPYQCWWGKRPRIDHFRVFGCVVWAHIPKEKRTKLDPKATQCIFVGYSEHAKAYVCWDAVRRKHIISRDVYFGDEAVFHTSGRTQTQSLLESTGTTPIQSIMIQGNSSDPVNSIPSTSPPANSSASTSPPRSHASYLPRPFVVHDNNRFHILQDQDDDVVDEEDESERKYDDDHHFHQPDSDSPPSVAQSSPIRSAPIISSNVSPSSSAIRPPVSQRNPTRRVDNRIKPRESTASNQMTGVPAVIARAPGSFTEFVNNLIQPNG